MKTGHHPNHESDGKKFNNEFVTFGAVGCGIKSPEVVDERSG